MDMIKNTHCLLCGAEAELREQSFPGYQKPETFAIYNCPSCCTSFSLPRIDTSALYNRIYQAGDTLPGYSRYWLFKSIVKQHPDPLQYLYETEETYWSVITVVKDKVIDKQNTQILEVGCGMGYLTYSLVQAGYKAIGLDISQKAIGEAIQNFGEHYVCADVFEYVEKHKGTYDLIIMAEVIEHIEKPIEFLQQVVSMLKKNGIVVVTTPNKTIFTNDVIWNTDYPPVHCWWFSESSMKYIANQIECKIDFVDFREFYKKKPNIVKTNVQYPTQYRFEESGEVIIDEVYRPSLKDGLLHITPPILLYWYRKIKVWIFPKWHLCNKEGITLCAVFQKNNDNNY